MKKQLLSIILALLPMLAMADESGWCGENVTYTFESSTGTLTIQGSGAMKDYYNGPDALISEHAPWYSYCSNIKTVIIEEGVTSIGRYAFYNCSVTSVTIPNSVTVIGGAAFYYCSDLTSVTIPNSVTNIGGWAFRDCSGLTSVIIPNSVTSIGSSAFEGCSGLTYVTIGNSVTSIGQSAFSGCSSLTSITIPNSVKIIEKNTFYSCKGLTSVTIPNSVTSIGTEAFSRCSGLSFITIGNSVTSIGGSAFEGCSGLTSITIPNSVTSIGYDAFFGCSGLKKVIVPDIAVWCGISFTNNSANPLNIVHHIYSDENTEITEIVIPEGVKKIGQYAFYSCEDITSVTIPSSVTRIGSNAFSCGIKLSEVNVNMNIPIEIDESVFKYTGENYSKDIIYLVATLKVPNGSKNLYSNVEGWKKFANIQEVDFSGVETIKQKSTPTSYYSVSGEKLNNVHRGVNIIRMSDGTTRKVVVK